MAELSDGKARMIAFANRQPLPVLCESLLLLDAKAAPDEAERLTRAVLIDVICERSPAAEAAFQAWAESDDMSAATAVQVITAAVKTALELSK